MIECTSSPTGCHQYDVNKASRDDSGFWLDCCHCGAVELFTADTIDELHDMFGLDYDE